MVLSSLRQLRPIFLVLMPAPGRFQQDARVAFAAHLRRRLGVQWLLAAAVGSLFTNSLGCDGKRANADRGVTATPVAAALVPAAPAKSAEPMAARPTCGLADMPECPLQRWMDHHLNGPLSRGEYPAIEQGFHDLAAVAPAAFTGWKAWAEGGAAAANQRDHDAISKACKGCHDGYRERYRQTMRDRPIASSELP